MVPRHILCVGTIVLRGDRCLLVRQAAGASLAGQWSIPWGYVDEAETPDVAAERETFEEAGVRVRAVGIAAVQVLPGDDGGIGIVFRAVAIDDGAPRPDQSETDDARFLSAAEIESLPVEGLCRQLALDALAGELGALLPASNSYDLPGWAR
jgi:ADP-ribose pyrophosphatase YjhB (NUDIX family)